LTFSIVAVDEKTKALGVAVSTAMPAVGSRVPYVEASVGAIATQGQTNTFYGIEGLKLLKSGLSPEKALKAMLLEDKEREKRQVIMIDAQGGTAAFTGRETDDWKGHLIGKCHVVAGNMLKGGGVLKAMKEAFEADIGNLAERLLSALEAGQEAGGDKRGHLSAALKVADKRWIGEAHPILYLTVDAHLDPVRELRRVYVVSRKYFDISE
jgi:uncharacterized Ntn-hydrolase superfamily protein